MFGRFLKWLDKRRQEPSTPAGLAMFVGSVMTLTKANPAHTEVVTSTVENVAQNLMSGDYHGAAAMGVGGLFAMLMGEKAQK